MFLLLAVGAVAALCTVIWRTAVYALPAFVGFSSGWWTLNHGAGLGCVAIGLAAGSITLLAARSALASSNKGVRLAVMALFLVPAAYTGYSIVLELAAMSIPSWLWRHAFAAIGAVAVAVTTLARLTEPTGR